MLLGGLVQVAAVEVPAPDDEIVVRDQPGGLLDRDATDVEAGEGKALGGAPQAEQLEAGDRGAGNRPTKTYQG